MVVEILNVNDRVRLARIRTSRCGVDFNPHYIGKADVARIRLAESNKSP